MSPKHSKLKGLLKKLKLKQLKHLRPTLFKRSNGYSSYGEKTFLTAISLASQRTGYGLNDIHGRNDVASKITGNDLLTTVNMVRRICGLEATEFRYISDKLLFSTLICFLEEAHKNSTKASTPQRLKPLHQVPNIKQGSLHLLPSTRFPTLLHENFVPFLEQRTLEKLELPEITKTKIKLLEENERMQKKNDMNFSCFQSKSKIMDCKYSNQKPSEDEDEAYQNSEHFTIPKSQTNAILKEKSIGYSKKKSSRYCKNGWLQIPPSASKMGKHHAHSHIRQKLRKKLQHTTTTKTIIRGESNKGMLQSDETSRSNENQLKCDTGSLNINELQRFTQSDEKGYGSHMVNPKTPKQRQSVISASKRAYFRKFIQSKTMTFTNKRAVAKTSRQVGVSKKDQIIKSMNGQFESVSTRTDGMDIAVKSGVGTLVESGDDAIVETKLDAKVETKFDTAMTTNADRTTRFTMNPQQSNTNIPLNGRPTSASYPNRTEFKPTHTEVRPKTAPPVYFSSKNRFELGGLKLHQIPTIKQLHKKKTIRLPRANIYSAGSSFYQYICARSK